MDKYNRSWIIENGISVLEGYREGVTVRQMYYRLVARGMVNDQKHYKRVVAAMTAARWKGVVRFDAFIDRERSMFSSTKARDVELDDEISHAKEQIDLWMRSYSRNRWENQDAYIEIWVEKMALQGVFERPCMNNDVGLAPCKGYPSLSFLQQAKWRFNDAIERDQIPTITYFGDYDPSGEDIPRSVQENLARMGCEVELDRVALNQQQITEMGLPSVPAKITDSRSKNWGGAGAVELDAVEPHTLAKMIEAAIQRHFDNDAYDTLIEIESEEGETYRKELKKYVEGL